MRGNSESSASSFGEDGGGEQNAHENHALEHTGSDAAASAASEPPPPSDGL